MAYKLGRIIKESIKIVQYVKKREQNNDTIPQNAALFCSLSCNNALWVTAEDSNQGRVANDNQHITSKIQYSNTV